VKKVLNHPYDGQVKKELMLKMYTKERTESMYSHEK
jgi:hypothetical protein